MMLSITEDIRSVTEKTMQAMNLLRLLIPAEEEVKEGRVREAAAFFEDFRRARNAYCTKLH